MERVIDKGQFSMTKAMRSTVKTEIDGSCARFTIELFVSELNFLIHAFGKEEFYMGFSV
jgi:hypothetical protein